MKKNETKDVTGIILCGGKSSRMGFNKALLEYEGKRLIDRVLDVMKDLFEEVLLVTNTPREYAGLDAEIVTDIIPGKGALGGIYTGLFYATRERAFVCACDMPFLDREFIRYLIARPGTHDIVIPWSEGGRQPLHAVYARRLIQKIERQIADDRLKISGLYETSKVLEIKPEEVEAHSREARRFMNVNTTEDWEKITNVPADA